jgi:hypothetical protein
MDYFAGLDISMDETHVCVLRPRRRGGSREQDGVDCASGRQRIGESAEFVASYSRRGRMATAWRTAKSTPKDPTS